MRFRVLLLMPQKVSAYWLLLEIIFICAGMQRDFIIKTVILTEWQTNVVVVDYFALESNKVVKEDGKFVHFSLDSISLSKMKVRAVCDMFDNNSHFNVSGGHKITSFMGKYRIENCVLGEITGRTVW